MAKFLKIAASLLVLLVLTYLGAHYWLRWKRTVRDDVTKVGRLVECEPNEVRTVSIERNSAGGGETLTFERADVPAAGATAAVGFAQADWRYRSPLTGEADGTLLRRIASTVCELWDPVLVREQEVGEPAGTEGLARALHIGLSGGGKVELGFGAAGADRLVPIRVKDASGKVKAAKVPDLLLQTSSRPAQDYRSRLVMRMEADNVQRATLKIDGKERFTLERAGADWVVLAGGKKLGDSPAEAGKFVNRIATLQALEVLEPEYGPKQCRTLKARAELGLSGVAGREETVIFDYGRGGDIAACSTARTMKFRVHRDLVKYLDVSPRALLAN